MPDERAGVVYTKEVGGETREITAYTPADRVKLEFEGWRPRAGQGWPTPTPPPPAPARRPRPRLAVGPATVAGAASISAESGGEESPS